MYDLRDCFFDEVLNFALEDSRIVVVTNDMDVFSLRLFRERFPERFINVGVAEQNMVNIAAGLASCGKKVVIYGITPFLIYRCFEQIKFNICSMNLPVVFAGIGSGLSFSYDGPTHHATHDIGALNTLPEVEIYNPGDAYSGKLAAQLAIKSNSPTFVRIDKGLYPILNNNESIVENCYSILRPLQAVNLITTGSMTQKALVISDILKAKNINIGVVDVLKLKPLSFSFSKNIINKSKKILTLEEHESNTGLGAIISRLCLQYQVSIYQFGTIDKQIFDYGERDWLLKKMNLDIEYLSDKIEIISNEG